MGNFVHPPSLVDTKTSENSTRTIVQRLVFPDPDVNTEYELFFHKDGMHAGFDAEKKKYFALKGASLQFDSYFNAFPAHLLDLVGRRICINIRAEGYFVVNVVIARHENSIENIFQSFCEFDLQEDKLIEIPDINLDGLIFVKIFAISDTVIHSIDYSVIGSVGRDVSITAVITTFKRNEAIQKTGHRLKKYFDENPDLLSMFQLLVIDNGGETNTIPFAKSKIIKNKNLGGAGGFTRGLMEVAEKRLSSHVLFMDDDASFFPESLRRTIAVLKFNSLENLAISGAMITEQCKWRMWENAATFNQRCRPIDIGKDLRIFKNVMTVSIAQPRYAKNKYGGWWYFCFPVNSVEVWPFPFFVRGDDSYFSLSNNFEIVTIPGVVAHQEDFFIKQTPLTVYLDFRYHIVHHLTFKSLYLSSAMLFKMVSRYFFRFNNSYHYESAAIINLAITDVLQGEKFWEENADMSNRRNLISEMVKNEKILNILNIDTENFVKHSSRRNKGMLASFFRKISFNGHIIPGVFFYKKNVCFPLEVRAIEHDTFRRRSTLTMDEKSGKGYFCSINRKIYFKNLFIFLKLIFELLLKHKKLRMKYTQAAVVLTDPQAWKKRFSKN